MVREVETEVDTEQKDGDQPQLRSSNGKHPRIVKGDKPFVDPQFCPSTLAFILWVSHSPIVLIWHRYGPFRLSRSPSLGWAYMWYIECVYSYWHHAIGSK